MVSKDKLKHLAKDNGLSLKDVSEILGLHYGTFMNRLSKGYLKSNEVEALIAVFRLNSDQYEPIFFDRLNKNSFD